MKEMKLSGKFEQEFGTNEAMLQIDAKMQTQAKCSKEGNITSR